MQPHIISLAGGLPAPDTFDVPGCAPRSTRCWPARTRSGRCSTRRPRATRRLRSRLAAFMSRAACPSKRDELLITTGSQQALGLVAAALLNPGDVVLVEDPTYLAALQTFGLADLRADRDPRGRATGPTPRR